MWHLVRRLSIEYDEAIAFSYWSGRRETKIAVALTLQSNNKHHISYIVSDSIHFGNFVGFQCTEINMTKYINMAHE